MFTITNQQLKRMQQSKLEKLETSIFDLILNEFSELKNGSDEELKEIISSQLKIARNDYKLKSFDALEDFILLSLQHNELIGNEIPKPLYTILTWPSMADDDKISEIENILIQEN